MNKDVRALLTSNAQTIKASMEVGASEFLGVDTRRVKAVERMDAQVMIPAPC